MSLPATMKAMRLFQYGEPSVLTYIDAPLPEVGPRDVLLRVHATSVNWWDLAYRRGFMKAPPGRAALPMPFQLGREAAGEIAAVGSEVTTFKVGQRAVQMTCPACGHCDFCIDGKDNLCVNVGYPGHQRFGGYAEYVSLKETDVLHAPDQVSFDKLACALWSYATIWQMARRGEMQPGFDVMITGASGGMGSSAIQVAKVLQARKIIGVSGSPHKSERLRELGCTEVVNYKTEDLPARVKQLTSGLGVHLVLDCVGGNLLAQGMGCLRIEGVLVNAAVLAGNSATIDLHQLFRLPIKVIGSRGATRRDQRAVLALVGEGKIDPVIYKTMPLSDAAEAHRLLESQEQIGKIVLRP